MIVLVYDDQVAGIGESLDNLPTGFSAYEVPKAPLEQLYFDGKKVLQKPVKPSDTAIWFGDRWVEPKLVLDLPVSFSQSEEFEYIFGAALSRLEGTSRLQASPEVASGELLLQAHSDAAANDIQTLFTVALYADLKGDRRLLAEAQDRLRIALEK